MDNRHGHNKLIQNIDIATLIDPTIIHSLGPNIHLHCNPFNAVASHHDGRPSEEEAVATSIEGNESEQYQHKSNIIISRHKSDIECAAAATSRRSTTSSTSTRSRSSR